MVYCNTSLNSSDKLLSHPSKSRHSWDDVHWKKIWVKQTKPKPQSQDQMMSTRYNSWEGSTACHCSPDFLDANDFESEVDRVHGGRLPLEHLRTPTTDVRLNQSRHKHDKHIVYSLRQQLTEFKVYEREQNNIKTNLSLTHTYKKNKNLCRYSRTKWNLCNWLKYNAIDFMTDFLWKFAIQ